MLIPKQIIKERADVVEAQIERQFNFFREALAESVLKSATIRAILATNTPLASLNKQAAASVSMNIASIIVDEQTRRGPFRDAFCTLLQGEKLMEQTAKLFLHELLSQDVILIGLTIPASIYTTDINHRFAAMMALVQYGERRYRHLLEAGATTFPQRFTEMARAYQKTRQQQRLPPRYDNERTSLMLSLLERRRKE